MFNGKIDSHVHFWQYNKKRDTWITDDMKLLKEDYLPEHLSLTLKRNEIDGVIAVQADQSEVETRFLVELSKTHHIIKGVVGWVDLQSDNLSAQLEYFKQFPVIKGWRHVAQSEPAGFLLKDAFVNGVASLKEFDYTYDILIYHHQIKDAVAFADRLPDQKLILDHCGKPGIKNKSIDDWAKGIHDLAAHPNIYCKLSGLFTEAYWNEWTTADFYPYLDVVFKEFGTDRLVFGSDWPVMLLSGMYVQWKSLLEKYMENYKVEDREKVFGQNAAYFYNID